MDISEIYTTITQGAVLTYSVRNAPVTWTILAVTPDLSYFDSKFNAIQRLYNEDTSVTGSKQLSDLLV